MRGRGAFALTTMAATAAAALGGLAAAGAAPTTSACNPKGSKTLLSNREARVYTVPDDPEYTRGYSIEACHYATGRATALDDGAFSFAFRPPGMRLEGSRLAYGNQFDTDPNEGENQVWIDLIDLRRTNATGEAHLITARPAWYGEQDHVVKVGSIRFGRDGSLAWITCPASDAGFNAVGADNTDLRPNCVRPGDRDSVLVAGPRRKDRTRRVAHGRNIHPGSLRREGRRVTWLQGGSRRSARLPG
jgi:hypothetical protein